MKRTFASVALVAAALVLGGCSSSDSGSASEASVASATATASSASKTYSAEDMSRDLDAMSGLTPTSVDKQFDATLTSRGMPYEDLDTRRQRGKSICSGLSQGDSVEQMVKTLSWKYSDRDARIIIGASQDAYCPETK
ncbi:DUF732 domain-containing protein [Rhodococcus hoagii]|nr:DUF732 domain-containing protein [Prescottella equi]